MENSEPVVSKFKHGADTKEEEEILIELLEDPDYHKLVTEKEFFAELYKCVKAHNEKCTQAAD